MSEPNADSPSEIEPDKPPKPDRAVRPGLKQAGRRLARVAAFAMVRGAGNAIGGAVIATAVLWWQSR